MYENDYSWIPSFFGGLMALAALGGLMISLIQPDTIRSRALRIWLLVPVLLCIGMGVVAAVFGENLDRYSPVLFAPIFAVIISPPWLIAAVPVYVFGRFIKARAQRGKLPSDCNNDRLLSSQIPIVHPSRKALTDRC